MGDAAGLVGDLVGDLWIALTGAIAVFLAAGASVVLGPLGRRVEARLLPWLTRRMRARRGLPADAPPWACGGCESVNVPAADHCYRCGVPRARDAPELREAAANPAIYHPPSHAGAFDASRYRGPGAPPPPPPGAAERGSGDEPVSRLDA